MVESFKGDMILTAGRGTAGIGFANDVWRSSDGSSWCDLIVSNYDSCGFVQDSCDQVRALGEAGISHPGQGK